jgi:hypothetical protein
MVDTRRAAHRVDDLEDDAVGDDPGLDDRPAPQAIEREPPDENRLEHLALHASRRADVGFA